MVDNKPASPDRKTTYIAPLVIGAVVIAFLLGTMLRDPVALQPTLPDATKVPTPIPAPAPAPPVAKTPSPLNRSELILDARQAADDFAASGRMPSGIDPLVGRRFSIKIPFGCGGLQTYYGPSQMLVTYSADNQSVTLAATPGVWTAMPLVQELSNASELDSVEGFWIPRPWTTSQSCPPKIDYPLPATPTPPASPTLGLAQFFEKGQSRIPQHADHPYAYTRKVSSDDASLLGHSYRLVLEGTITKYMDGRALRCWMEAPDHQPLCVFAVRLDHVAFEDADTNDVLANWNE